jgi:hypothetical protein
MSPWFGATPGIRHRASTFAWASVISLEFPDDHLSLREGVIALR